MSSDDVVLTLRGVKHAALGLAALERLAAASLNLPDGAVSLIEDDPDWMLIVYGAAAAAAAASAADASADVSAEVSALALAEALNAGIQTGQTSAWLSADAVCAVAAEEEEVLVDEAEAYRLWREETADRTSHLAPVSDPDGRQVVPAHAAAPSRLVRGALASLPRRSLQPPHAGPHARARRPLARAASAGILRAPTAYLARRAQRRAASDTSSNKEEWNLFLASHSF